MICLFLICLGLIIDAVTGECPDGFERHRDSCYKIWATPATFAEATAICKIYGTHIAMVENDNEENFLAGEMSRHAVYADTYFWIGASDMLVEGEWKWITNLSFVEYSKWAAGQPDNHIPASEHCLAIHYTGLTTSWYDMPCEGLHYFICETPLHNVNQQVTINIQTGHTDMFTHFLTTPTTEKTDANGNIIG